MLEKSVVIRQYLESGNREVEFYHTYRQFDKFGNDLGLVTETKRFGSKTSITNSSRKRVNTLMWRTAEYRITPWVGKRVMDITIARKS